MTDRFRDKRSTSRAVRDGIEWFRKTSLSKKSKSKRTKNLTFECLDFDNFLLQNEIDAHQPHLDSPLSF